MMNKVYPLHSGNAVKHSGFKAAEMLRYFAWLAIAVGTFLFAVNVNDFRGDNLGLMVAIGFLIAGMNIFLLGTVFSLLHTSPSEK